MHQFMLKIIWVKPYFEKLLIYFAILKVCKQSQEKLLNNTAAPGEYASKKQILEAVGRRNKGE